MATAAVSDMDNHLDSLQTSREKLEAFFLEVYRETKSPNICPKHINI